MKSITSKTVSRLTATVQKELDKLRELLAEASAYSVDTVNPRVIGSLLHDFYTGIERIFQKIANDLEENAPDGRGWHKALLEDMALDIPQVRPRVITDEFAKQLDDYLRFRHLFRGIYGFELETERMRPLFDHVGEVLQNLESQLQIFFAALTRIVNDLAAD